MHDFTGFSDRTLTFLAGLKANNARDWFAEHKVTYETEIKGPAIAFGAAMAENLQEMTGHEYQPKLFRVHRDMRFSKDKTPYNAHLHMSFRSDAVTPAWMFGLNVDKLSLGLGVFKFNEASLNKFRSVIAGDNGPEIASMLQGLVEGGARLSEPALKRVPNGYDKDHPNAELLRHKGLGVWRDHAPGFAIGDDLPARTSPEFAKLLPVFDLLRNI